MENVITNPLPGDVGTTGVNGGDPGLELRVSAGEPRGGRVKGGELATVRRDMKYGSFRAGIKYTPQDGTCGAFFFVSSRSRLLCSWHDPDTTDSTKVIAEKSTLSSSPNSIKILPKLPTSYSSFTPMTASRETNSSAPRQSGSAQLMAFMNTALTGPRIALPTMRMASSFTKAKSAYHIEAEVSYSTTGATVTRAGALAHRRKTRTCSFRTSRHISTAPLTLPTRVTSRDVRTQRVPTLSVKCRTRQRHRTREAIRCF